MVDNEVDRFANRVSSEEMEDDIDEAVDTEDAIRFDRVGSRIAGWVTAMTHLDTRHRNAYQLAGERD